jgi:predicted secreted hydrolase
MKRIIVLATLAIVVVAVLAILMRAPSSSGLSAEVVGLGSGDNAAGFARADHVRPFVFPDDQGPHPEYQTEWWYYTGNLETSTGRHFGYQLTFFRRALTPALASRASDWAANQIYFAHFALTDVQSNEHFAAERFSRGAAGLAGAVGNPHRVWLENWELKQIPLPAGTGPQAAPTAVRRAGSPLPAGTTRPASLAGVTQAAPTAVRRAGSPLPAAPLARSDQAAPPAGTRPQAAPTAVLRAGSPLPPPAYAWQMHAEDSGQALALTLRSPKPPVLHGDGGLSQKTNAVGNASYYFSLTRLETEGSLTMNGETFDVRGLSWMDQEFGTTGLGPQAVGWDWFSIQLSDRRELMFFQIRQKDGSVEPLSSGTLVNPDGTTHHLTREQVNVEVLDRWTSPASRAVYPARWGITIPSENISLTLRPYVSDQEMRVSFTYWEGAVEISGLSGGAQVQGSGYVELTGYAAPMTQ